MPEPTIPTNREGGHDETGLLDLAAETQPRGRPLTIPNQARHRIHNPNGYFSMPSQPESKIEASDWC